MLAFWNLEGVDRVGVAGGCLLGERVGVWSLMLAMDCGSVGATSVIRL